MMRADSRKTRCGVDIWRTAQCHAEVLTSRGCRAALQLHAAAGGTTVVTWQFSMSQAMTLSACRVSYTCSRSRSASYSCPYFAKSLVAVRNSAWG
jgi:hypothetical protein